MAARWACETVATKAFRLADRTVGLSVAKKAANSVCWKAESTVTKMAARLVCWKVESTGPKLAECWEYKKASMLVLHWAV